MTEKFKIESASGGETWGETRKRIVLQETETAGVSGLAVSDVLKILGKWGQPPFLCNLPFPAFSDYLLTRREMGRRPI